MSLLALALIPAAIRVGLTPDDVLIWLVSTGLLAAACLVNTPVQQAAWTGYPHLLALTVWMTHDLPVALACVVVGSIIAAGARMRWGPALRLPEIAPLLLVSMALGRIAMTGMAVVVASAVYSALNQTTLPVLQLDRQSAVALIVALAAANLTATATGAVLAGQERTLLSPTSWARWSRHAPREVILAVKAVVLALIAAQVSAALYAALLLLLGVQVVRTSDANRGQQATATATQDRFLEPNVAQEDIDPLLETLYWQARQIHEAPVMMIALYEREMSVLNYRLATVNGERVTRPPSSLDDSVAATAVRLKTAIQVNCHDESQLRALNISPGPTEQRYPIALAVPILDGSDVLGVMALMKESQQGEFDSATVAALQTLTHEFGSTLRHAIHHARGRELESALSKMTSYIQAMTLSTDKNQAIERVCEAAMSLGRADAVALFLVDRSEDKVELAHMIGLTARQRAAYAYHPPIYDHQRQEARLVMDVETAGGDDDLRAIARLGGFRAVTEIPLQSSNATLGSLTLYYRAPHYSRQSELELLQTLCNQAAAIIDNAALFFALESYAFEMAQLAQLSRISTFELDLNQVVRDAADILCQVVTVSRATVALVDPATNRLRAAVTHLTPERPPLIPPQEAQVRFPELATLLNESWPEMRVFQAGDIGLSEPLIRLMAANGEETLVVLPMMSNDALVGTILLGSTEKRVFSNRERQLVETATNQIAAQIQNARLFTATRQALTQRLEELALIEGIAQQISSALDFDQIVEYMLETAIRGTQGAYAALILLPDDNRPQTVVVDYANGRVTRHVTALDSDDSTIREVVRSGKMVLTPDTRAEPRFHAPRTGTAYLSALAVPLIQDQAVVGVLNVASEHLHFFSEEHARFLNSLAGHAVISIGNARMLEERQYQVRVLASLQTLALRLSSTVDSRAVAQAILETTLDLIDGQEAALFRRADPSQEFRLLATLERDQTAVEPNPIGPMLRSSLIQEGVNETGQTGEIRVVQAPSRDGPFTSAISVPLKRGGETREVLCVAFTDQRHFPRRELETLARLGSQAAGHLENAMLHEQIRAGNERMAAILNSTRDGVILLDRRGGLVDANPAARALLGDGLDTYVHEVIGPRIWKRRDPAQRDTGALRDHVDSLKSEPITRRRFEHQTAKGTITIDEIGAPVVDAHDRAVGWLLVLRDVTEEKLLADYRDEITSMVVHDLRGPLASIISGICLALDEISGRDELDLVQKTLALSSDSAHQLMVLVDSLLDIARMEAREMPLRLKATSVEEMVDKAEAALTATLQQSEIRLIRTIPAQLSPALVDSDVIVRVVINLLDNALRHTPAGQDILIGAEPVAEGNSILIRVADSGRGVPAEERALVFEKFKQVKASAATYTKRGTGLGLTFCRLAVEAHGGRIWVEDEGPLSGASFAFTLPAASGSQQPVQESLLNRRNGEHLDQ